MVKELVHRNNRVIARRRPLRRAPRLRQFQGSLILFLCFAITLLATTWTIKGLSGLELAVLFAIAVLCIYPLVRWFRLSMRWLPLGESFVFMHIIYYVLPCLAGRADVLWFPESRRLTAMAGVTLFLVAFITTYRWLLRSHALQARVHRIHFLEREMNLTIMWGMFAIWIAWSTVLNLGLTPDLGAYLNVCRSIAAAMGCVSLANLFYRMGRNQLKESERYLAFAGLVAGLGVNFINGQLIVPAEWMGASLLAYTLGSRKIPIIAVVVAVGILSILQLGKQDYRDKFFSDDLQARKAGLVERYTSWLGSSGKSLNGTREDRTTQADLTDRTSLFQVLAWVMEVSPNMRPFVYGQTYAMMPELLIPRVFWSDKPRGTLPTETLGIYYGLQTEEGAVTTGISMGPVVEGWANFGWIGLAGAGAVFGLFFGLPAVVSRSFSPTQVGWLLASVFLTYATDMEHSLPEICCALVTSEFVAVLLLFCISHPPAVPRGAKRRFYGPFEETA